MFGAGLVKLRGDECWRDLTCLEYHYETQPLPNPLSWHLHWSPSWLHRLGVGFTHVVQLVVPFLYFVPGPVSWAAGAVTILFQGTLIVSGNLSWLNWLTVALAFACFGDPILSAVLPGGMGGEAWWAFAYPEGAGAAPRPPAHDVAVWALAVLVAAKSVEPVKNLLSRRQRMTASFDPLHLVNAYGAFGSVTRTRYQVVVEGPRAEAPGPEADWRAYEFRGNPGDPARRPPVVSPYHLRLDCRCGSCPWPPVAGRPGSWASCGGSWRGRRRSGGSWPTTPSATTRPGGSAPASSGTSSPTPGSVAGAAGGGAGSPPGNTFRPSRWTRARTARCSGAPGGGRPVNRHPRPATDMSAMTPRRRAPRAPCARSAALLSALALLAAPLAAQDEGGDPEGARARLPLDSAVTTRHTVTVDGEEVPYTATAGTLPVYDEESGEAVASLFYVYYERTDVEDRSSRPLTFSFNGGPGSASVWMHIGYTGPRLVKIDDEGFPVQPYGVEENSHTILDVTDIVYVDPVNTGFARAVEGVDESRFFGVNEDVRYLAGWMDTFVSRRGRWTSPKFLIGESYGTTRVSGLAGALQGRQWMYLNGVVLVSPTSLGIEREGPVDDALLLPHYAATAWYHEQLPPELQERDLEEVLAEVEEFTVEEYVPALVYGNSLDDARRERVAGRVAGYAGVDEGYVLNNNLTIPVSFWRKEMMREEGLTVGRLDARYRGVDREAAGESYSYDPALAAWNHAFTPAINHYLRDVLGWETDLQYNVFGPVRPWNRDGNRTGEMLRQAMAENPFLKLMVQSGYYDGATDYFSARYNLWHMDPAGRLTDRMRWEGYRSGHMMYLRTEDLETANDDLRDFIEWATPAPGEPARW